MRRIERSKRFRTLLPLIATIIAALSSLQCAVFLQPEEAAVTPERVDGIFAEWDRDDSPGCALAVIRDDRADAFVALSLEDFLELVSEWWEGRSR